MDNSLNYQCQQFESKQIGETVVLTLIDGVFEIATERSKTEQFFSLLENAESSADIKAILILNSPGSLNEEKYLAFINKVFYKNQNSKQGIRENSLVEQERLFFREEHTNNHFIQKINKYKKLTFAGIRGEVSTPFFGICLAYDFRFVSENVTFSLEAGKLGLPVNGALGFYLPRFIGQGKAIEIIHSGHSISAAEALDLGLVNAIFPEKGFDEACIKKVKEISKSPSLINACNKAMFTPRGEELEQYLDKELDVMRRFLYQHPHI